ncbi:MAG: hypothetical protein K5Q19_17080, partial [Novosphingobium sp.]|nr:hypothetical protein [Novosphingobium sp.]
MTPTQFVSELSAIRFPNAFNPYSDACPVHDVPDAPAMRSAILTQILEAAEAASVDAIWVGRDLGFRGGRRTGMALTDDVHFHDHLGRVRQCGVNSVVASGRHFQAALGVI